MAKQFCHQNSLILNKSKTQQLSLGRLNNEIPVLPDLELKNEAKYLGLIIDNKLTWTPHVEQLCKKLSSSLYALKRIKSIGNLDAVKVAYFSLFDSHLRYGLVIWGNSSIANLKRVLILQKKAVRILAGLDPMASCRQAFKEQNILTVVSLYVSEVICYSVSQNIARLGQIHTYDTRNSINYALPVHHLSLSEKKPSYAGCKFFNILPDTLKRTSGQKNFKTRLKEWLLLQTFYSIEEFANWRNN